MVQYEVQGFHWNNLQFTLHLVVIYFKDKDELHHKSYCIISNDMKHDPSMINKIGCLI